MAPTRPTPYFGGTGQDNRGKINVHPTLQKVSIGSDILPVANLHVYGNSYALVQEAASTNFQSLNVFSTSGGATSNTYSYKSSFTATHQIGVAANTISLSLITSGALAYGQLTHNSAIAQIYFDIDNMYFRNRSTSVDKGIWSPAGLGVGTNTPEARVDVTGNLKVQSVSAKMVTLSNSTGNVTHDWSQADTWYHTTPTSNFSANFTNVTVVASRLQSATLFINAGANAYFANTCSINNVVQTIFWSANTVPAGANGRVSLQTFLISNVNSTYNVFSMLQSF